jgi:hypothetical protein
MNRGPQLLLHITHDCGPILRKRAYWMLALVFPLLPMSAQTLTNFATRYSGIYSYRAAQSPTNWPGVIIHFSVQQSGCSWRIDMTDTSVPRHISNEYRGETAVYQSDGRYIYKRTGRLGSTGLDGGVTIYDEAYPASHERPMFGVSLLQNLQHIWTGYAASCVLAPPSGKARSPFLTDMQAFADPRLYHDYHYTGDSSAGTPWTLEFRDTGTIAIRGRDRPLSLGKPASSGGLSARCTWQPATVNGVACSNFVFAAYSPSDPVNPAYTARCTITNVSREPFALDLPKAGTAHMVTDRRASRDGYAAIRYVTDRGIPEVDSAQFQRERDRSKKLSLEEEATADGHTFVPLAGGAVAPTRRLGGTGSVDEAARWFLYLSPLGLGTGLFLGWLLYTRRQPVRNSD